MSLIRQKLLSSFTYTGSLGERGAGVRAFYIHHFVFFLLKENNTFREAPVSTKSVFWLGYIEI